MANTDCGRPASRPGDQVQLQQVIINLVVNAVEAMSEVVDRPRELTIVAGKGDSNELFVEVQDTGPGLDQANLDRLFHSFYTTKPEGMGMGLAISARSSRLMADGYRQRRMSLTALSFGSRCRSRARRRRTRSRRLPNQRRHRARIRISLPRNPSSSGECSLKSASHPQKTVLGGSVDRGGLTRTASSSRTCPLDRQNVESRSRAPTRRSRKRRSIGLRASAMACSEVLARGLVPPAAQLKLAKRRRVEGIRGEAIAVGNGADLFEPTLGPLILRDRDGTVQRDNRRGTYRHQRVVQ